MHDDIFMENLLGRVRAMNILWQRAVSDMTIDQVNHFERDGVLPIAFSLSHYMRGQDQSISRIFLNGETLWDKGGWAPRIGVNVDELGREQTVAEMQNLRFADFDAWRAYQSAVIEQTEAVLQSLTPERLAEVVFSSMPPPLSQTFCAIVVGPGAFRRLHALECFVFQHGIRHLGELEHARALVGLGGMTS